MPSKTDTTDTRRDAQPDLGADETDGRVIRDRELLRTAMADTDTARVMIQEAEKALREGEVGLIQAIAREREAFSDLAACIAIVRRAKP